MTKGATMATQQLVAHAALVSLNLELDWDWPDYVAQRGILGQNRGTGPLRKPYGRPARMHDTAGEPPKY